MDILGNGTPEQKLLVAILVRAVQDLFVPANGISSFARLDSYRWFLSSRKNRFSFYWICRHLDIDPANARAEIIEFMNDPYKSHHWIELSRFVR